MNFAKINPSEKFESTLNLSQRWKMINLLVIDDSETARLEFRQGMAAPDVNITDVGSASEALKILKSKPNFNLVFCDMNMPEMDGLQFLDVKAQDPQIKNVPVIMLSAMSTSEPLAKAKSLGAKAWIIKPANFDKLRTLIAKYR